MRGKESKELTNIILLQPSQRPLTGSPNLIIIHKLVALRTNIRASKQLQRSPNDTSDEQDEQDKRPEHDDARQ